MTSKQKRQAQIKLQRAIDSLKQAAATLDSAWCDRAATDALALALSVSDLSRRVSDLNEEGAS